MLFLDVFEVSKDLSINYTYILIIPNLNVMKLLAECINRLKTYHNRVSSFKFQSFPLALEILLFNLTYTFFVTMKKSGKNACMMMGKLLRILEKRRKNVIYYIINNLRRSFTNWLLNDAELRWRENVVFFLKRDEKRWREW